MDKKRSFTQIKKTMQLSEFEAFCKKLTEEYANSDAQFSRSYFCNRYNISESCYYKVMEFAVVMDLVSDSIVSKMLNKSMANQNLHLAGAGGSSIAKYARMYSARCEYIALSFIDDEVRKIAKDFVDNPDIPKQEIATMHGISKKVLDLLLVRGIEQCIVDDETVNKIEERSIKNSHPSNVQRTKEYFEALREKRKAYKIGVSFE